MKSIIESVNVQLQYPCLMISKHKLLVLFTDEQTGMVLHDESGDYCIGKYIDNLLIECFKPYYGRVVLQND